MGFLAPALPAIATVAGGLLGGRKGPSQQTVTQEASVPQQLLPGFNDALRSVLGQFGQSGSASGFENINQPLGRNLIGRTIAGQFLDPFQNPGLQGVLDRGGDFIKQRLNTDFARSGRDLGAARPAAADELGAFTSNTLFNNFNAERGRQQAALGQVGAFDPTNNFLDRFGALSNVASGNQATTVPLSQDRLSGALGGAQAGGAVGDILGRIFGQGGGTAQPPPSIPGQK
jgi:hypothetical protein